MTLSMTLRRGLEDVENPALLSPCHRQISGRLQLFWGKANAAGLDGSRENTTPGSRSCAISFQNRDVARQPDAPMSFASSQKSCGIVLDMFSECAIYDS
jgi:hypothetical protein